MRYTALLLIALIALNNAYTSPADQVLSKIDSLAQASRDEQAGQSKLYASQNQRCKSEVAFRTQESADAQVAAGAASAQLNLCRAEVPVAQASLRSSKAELKATKSQLRAVNSEHDIVEAVNLARQQEHNAVIEAIQGAYNIIGNFANGKDALSEKSLFVEVSAKINKAFKLAIKHKMHAQMIPVMSALAQITATPATTVSTSALQRVVELLRKLEANTRASEVARAKEQLAYHTLYTSQVELLNAQISELKSIIKRYIKYLGNLNACVSSEGKVLAEANAKFTRNSNILAATRTMCRAYDVKYTLQTKQRTDYVHLLGQLRAFVVSTIASFKSGLYSRGDFVAQH